MNSTEKLFTDFPGLTQKQWKEKAVEDLKGADYEKKLVWKTDDGFSVQPFYTIEDTEDKFLKNQYKFFTAESGRTWINYTEIKVEDIQQANKLALELQNFGAEGFLFKLESNDIPDFNTLLNGIDICKYAISFSIHKPSVAFLSKYLAYLIEKNIKATNVKGFLEADILENFVLRGCKIDVTELAEIIHLTKNYPGFQSLTIRSHAFVNAGSNTTQELAFTLNKLVDYIDLLSEAGLTPTEVINKVQFHMAISGDYFFEIAKLRAMRILLNGLMKLYGCNISTKILSSNSVWSKSFYDPNVNMLRNTSEAMSAILGGCDALLTYPHDYSFQEPSSFSQRIALNVSNLLKSESYFDKVNDPSAGSYYLESLTKNIADAALNLFKETEKAGGFINAYKTGSITEKINKTRDLKEKEIASRKRVYVGVNKYPDLQEKTPLDSHVASANVLKPQRATRLFEELKSKTIVEAQKTGKTPSVYLACFGDLAMRKARATFASEFFGTAGFDIIEEAFFKTPQQAAELSAISSADIVVMCSSDSEYETEAAAFATKFKSLAKGKLLVLAGYPENIVNELMNSGVDGFIHVRSNAIDVLTAFQKMINATY